MQTGRAQPLIRGRSVAAWLLLTSPVLIAQGTTPSSTYTARADPCVAPLLVPCGTTWHLRGGFFITRHIQRDTALHAHGSLVFLVPAIYLTTRFLANGRLVDEKTGLERARALAQ
jgi:hypothetical protein